MRRFIWLFLFAPLLLAACQSGGNVGGWAEKACRDRLPNATEAEINACAEGEYRRARTQEYRTGGP